MPTYAQQQPSMYGQYMQPTGMPMPMTMPAMPPIQTFTSKPPIETTSTTSQAPTSESEQSQPIGSAQDKDSTEKTAPSAKGTKNENGGFRAFWTHVEEENLIKVYADFTIGKRRKTSKPVWGAIAQRVYEESKKEVPCVNPKSWMQCKDKWNNMVKKLKYHKGEYNIQPSHYKDPRSSPMSPVFTLLEKMLKDSSHLEERGLDFHTDENGAADLNGETVENGEAEHEATECADHALDPGYEESINETENELHPVQAIEEEEMSFHTSDKRPASSEPDHNESKRLRPDVSHDVNRDSVTGDNIFQLLNKQTDLLSRQTELLERSQRQHNELMEQMKMSEENTRMMVLQAIQDLRTILNRLIKTEN